MKKIIYWIFLLFEGMTTKLTITATKYSGNKKNIILLTFTVYPVHYNPITIRWITEKITFCCTKNQLISQLLLDYGTSILKASNFNTIPFFNKLQKQLHDDFKG
jgi:hypothetical protein